MFTGEVGWHGAFGTGHLAWGIFSDLRAAERPHATCIGGEYPVRYVVRARSDHSVQDG